MLSAIIADKNVHCIFFIVFLLVIVSRRKVILCMVNVIMVLCLCFTWFYVADVRFQVN
jgi:hypothetical protein